MGFRRQMWLGYATSFLITLSAATFAVLALHVVANSQQLLSRQYTDQLLNVERLRYRAEHIIASTQGYLARPDDRAREQLVAALADFDARLTDVDAYTYDPIGMLRIATIHATAHHYVEIANAVASKQRSDAVHAINARLPGLRDTMRGLVDQLAHDKREAFEEALAGSYDRASDASILVGLTAGLGLALSACLATLVMRRLSRQRRAELQAADEARKSSAARQEVLAVVSHDLRGPLATILTGSELLATSSSKEATRLDAPRVMRMVKLAVDQTRHLVDQILDAGQLDAGALRLTPADHDVASLVQTCADVMAVHADQAAVHLHVQPPSMPTTIQVDRERLLQVLSNLVGNALKFSPRHANVYVRAEASDDGVRFSVEDEGPGIPPEQVGQLFERYWHANRGASGRGIGLGLYISKRLVDAHGGRIWVDSTPGQGARFCFTVPRASGPTI
jgi:signal transduction histidine kinase